MVAKIPADAVIATLAADLGVGIHIKTADSGATANAHADELVIENSANSGISILSGTSNIGRVNFGDSGDDDIGIIYYNHSDNSLTIRNNATDHMIINSAGAVTKPLQPAFNVNNSAAQTNIASGANITFDTERDYGAGNDHFGSNTFTAPVTGKYQLNLQLRLGQIDSASNYVFPQLETSNRSYQAIFDPSQSNGDLTYFYFSISVMADMDANDTADVHFYYSGGAQQVDTDAGGTSFSGALIC